MADARLDISALLAAAHDGKAVSRADLVKALQGLSQAAEHASWDGSDEITFLFDDGAVSCAVVPSEWARAIRELRMDPGGMLAQILAEQRHREAERLKAQHGNPHIVPRDYRPGALGR